MNNDDSGRDVFDIESVDHVPSLTEEEEQGIAAALAQLDAGKGIPLSDVVNDIRKRFLQQ